MHQLFDNFNTVFTGDIINLVIDRCQRDSFIQIWLLRIHYYG